MHKRIHLIPPGGRMAVTPAPTRCGIAAHAPVSTTTDPGVVTCPDCLLLNLGPEIASRCRRAELDRELEAMGATVIRVEDMGAVENILTARHYGAMAIQSMTDPDLDATGPDEYPEWASDVAGEWASDAAHLARVALGESS